MSSTDSRATMIGTRRFPFGPPALTVECRVCGASFREWCSAEPVGSVHHDRRRVASALGRSPPPPCPDYVGWPHEAAQLVGVDCEVGDPLAPDEYRWPLYLASPVSPFVVVSGPASDDWEAASSEKVPQIELRHDDDQWTVFKVFREPAPLRREEASVALPTEQPGGEQFPTRRAALRAAVGFARDDTHLGTCRPYNRGEEGEVDG